jgi:hypothetical protein
MSSDLQKEMRLGNLLVQLDLMSESDLSEASHLALELGLPLGKVLVMSDFLSEAQLAALIQAQSMLKDQLIELEVARRSLEIVSTRGLSWPDALKEAGWVEPKVIPRNQLGKLLVDARIISEAELDQALSSVKQSGLPLGRILSASGRVTEQVLVACLNAQVLLRDGKISREQAVKALTAANLRQTSLEQALIDAGEYKPPGRMRIKIGEMFVMAKLLSESIIMEVIEQGLVTQEPVGQVLVKAGHVNKYQLEMALKLQELVDIGKLSPLNAADALVLITSGGLSLEDAIAQSNAPRPSVQTQLTLADLLKLSGVLTEEDVAEAFRRSIQNPQIFGRIMVMSGLMDESGMDVALKCHNFIRQGMLREDQAIIALNYCLRMHCSLDQAAQDLGWTNPRNNFANRKRMSQEEIAATSAKAALQFFD